MKKSSVNEPIIIFVLRVSQQVSTGLSDAAKDSKYLKQKNFSKKN